MITIITHGVGHGGTHCLRVNTWHEVITEASLSSLSTGVRRRYIRYQTGISSPGSTVYTIHFLTLREHCHISLSRGNNHDYFEAPKKHPPVDWDEERWSTEMSRPIGNYQTGLANLSGTIPQSGLKPDRWKIAWSSLHGCKVGTIVPRCLL